MTDIPMCLISFDCFLGGYASFNFNSEHMEDMYTESPDINQCLHEHVSQYQARSGLIVLMVDFYECSVRDYKGIT